MTFVKIKRANEIHFAQNYNWNDSQKKDENKMECDVV